MKISKYKVYDASTGIGTEANTFALGKLEIGGTADASKRWVGIPEKDIIDINKVAAVAADVPWTQTFTPASAVAGDEYVLTVQIGDTRQKIRKVFKHIVVAGATGAAAICDAFRALIDASSLAIATSGTATLVLTADAAGDQFIVTSGVIGTGTFTGGAVTDSAEKTTGAYFAAKHSGIDSADFGSATDEYIGYFVRYKELVDSAHGKVIEERVGAIFIEGGTSVTDIEEALTGAYTTIANVGDRLDLLG